MIRTKSTIEILDFIKAMMVVGLSSLPYFHGLLTTKAGPKDWVPDIGLINFITDSEGYPLGFSNYRVFLYTFLIHVFFFVVWLAWLKNAKNRSYYYALYIPVILSGFQIALILFNLRYTQFNDVRLKLGLLLILLVICAFLYLRKEPFSWRTSIKWLGIVLAAMLPFIHDVLTTRGLDGVNSWVPVLGIEDALTGTDGKIVGFKTYRVFIYTLGLHLFAHLGSLGWFMDAYRKKYRAWILVPVAITLYQLPVIISNWSNTSLNTPSVKLYISLGICILLALNFFFNNKVENNKNQSI